MHCFFFLHFLFIRDHSVAILYFYREHGKLQKTAAYCKSLSSIFVLQILKINKIALEQLNENVQRIFNNECYKYPYSKSHSIYNIIENEMKVWIDPKFSICKLAQNNPVITFILFLLNHLYIMYLSTHHFPDLTLEKALQDIQTLYFYSWVLINIYFP